MVHQLSWMATALGMSVGGATNVPAAWTYKVRQDLLGDGLSSPMVVDDDAVHFTTFECIYNMHTGDCVNATGEFVSLDLKTGAEKWGTRFSGAGVNGALGKPVMPQILKEKGTAHAVVMGGETFLPDTWMRYFAAGISLNAADATCEVPKASGNRFPHALNATDSASCKKNSGCWDEGDQCDLVDTAQTVDCDSPNPEDEKTCTSKGCCWDGKYSPGRCFKGSPKCYAPEAKPLWLTPRPSNNTWESAPAVVRVGDDDVVVMSQCQGPTQYNEKACQIAAYKNGEPMWQVPIANSCKGHNMSVCVCPVGGGGPFVPAAAVGDGGAYFTACNSKGLILIGLSLADGKSLWPAQQILLLDTSFLIESPVAPVYSEEHGILYAAGWSGGAVGNITARSPKSGQEIWKAAAAGYKCNALKWDNTVLVSGDMVFVWDNFALRALEAKTGTQLWTTADQNFAVVSQLVPGGTIQNGSLLVVTNAEKQSCAALISTAPSYITAISTTDGKVLGRIATPASHVPAQFSPPVAGDGLWIIRGDSEWPHSHSTIYAFNVSAHASSMESFIV